MTVVIATTDEVENIDGEVTVSGMPLAFLEDGEYHSLKEASSILNHLRQNNMLSEEALSLVEVNAPKFIEVCGNKEESDESDDFELNDNVLLISAEPEPESEAE